MSRILLVEDYTSIGHLFAKVLRMAGFEVVYVETAEAALSIIRAEPFDLLITDIQLPGMDGVELMRTVRPLKSIPGISLSGDSIDEQERVAAGFAAHMTKPVDLDELVATVRRVLSAHGQAGSGQPSHVVMSASPAS